MNPLIDLIKTLSSHPRLLTLAIRWRPVWLVYALLQSLLPSSPLLAEPTPPRMAAQLQDSGQGFQGQVMLNQAAGNQLQQANGRIFTVGASSNAQLRIEQTVDPIALDSVGIHASASIAGASFAQGHGVLGVNQSAGVANQSINSFRMVLGALPEHLEDSILSQNAAPIMNSEAAVPQSGERVVEVDDRAFTASRGVVQLNQSAGVGNRTANNLSIRVME